MLFLVQSWLKISNFVNALLNLRCEYLNLRFLCSGEALSIVEIIPIWLLRFTNGFYYFVINRPRYQGWQFYWVASFFFRFDIRIISSRYRLRWKDARVRIIMRWCKFCFKNLILTMKRSLSVNLPLIGLLNSQIYVLNLGLTLLFIITVAENSCHY